MNKLNRQPMKYLNLYLNGISRGTYLNFYAPPKFLDYNELLLISLLLKCGHLLYTRGLNTLTLCNHFGVYVVDTHSKQMSNISK